MPPRNQATVDQVDNYWKSKCGKVRKNSNTGWSNVFSHIQTRRGDVLQSVKNSSKTESSSIEFSNLICFSKVKEVHFWVEPVIHGLQPFYFMENETIRKNMKVDLIFVGTLQNYYFEKLTQVVVQKISNRLPESLLWF